MASTCMLTSKTQMLPVQAEQAKWATLGHASSAQSGMVKLLWPGACCRRHHRYRTKVTPVDRVNWDLSHILSCLNNLMRYFCALYKKDVSRCV